MTTQTAQLAHAAGFTLNELDANRKGQLAPSQLKRLRQDERRQLWPSLIAWGILAALVGTLVLRYFTSLPGWIAPALTLIAFAGIIAYQFRQDMPNGHVLQETFRVDNAWKPNRRLDMLEFNINNRWFNVSRAVEPLLQPGQTYRFYFTPDVISFPFGGNRMKIVSLTRTYGISPVGSFRVLSIEPVE